MGCLKGFSPVKKKDAKFTCEQCGSQVKKKSQVCKPIKVKAKEGKNSKKK